MENATLKKKVYDFLNTEKSGDGKKVGKAFKDALVTFVSAQIFDSVKDVQDKIPMKYSIPGADASVIDAFEHDVGEEVYYVIFKQVRSQVKGKLQVKFGYQFTVCHGKITEIHVRTDHAVLYVINGDVVLHDLVYKDEEEALKRCKRLNDGTDGIAIEGAESVEPEVVSCSVCGAIIDAKEVGHQYGTGVICDECFAKLNKEVDTDGGEDEGSTADTGTVEVGVVADGAAD